jgi:hypothetical protein
MLRSAQARQGSASREPGYVRPGQAQRKQIAFQELGPRSQWKPNRGRRRNQPRELAFYWSVESVKTLKDESIAVQREFGIEQVQLSLERLVVGRGFSAQPKMKR